jgi:hypothetical protein
VPIIRPYITRICPVHIHIPCWRYSNINLQFVCRSSEWLVTFPHPKPCLFLFSLLPATCQSISFSSIHHFNNILWVVQLMNRPVTPFCLLSNATSHQPLFECPPSGSLAWEAVKKFPRVLWNPKFQSRDDDQFPEPDKCNPRPLI